MSLLHVEPEALRQTRLDNASASKVLLPRCRLHSGQPGSVQVRGIEIGHARLDPSMLRYWRALSQQATDKSSQSCAKWNSQKISGRAKLGVVKTGAAMSLVNQCDTRRAVSAGWNQNQHAFRPAGQADRTGAGGIEPQGTMPGGSRANRLTFAEDFMLEHSGACLQIAVIGMAGANGTAAKDAQPSTQFFGFPS